MEHTEYKATFQLALDDSAAIVHNQQILAGIHAELDKNLSNPFEQDFIYEEHFGLSSHRAQGSPLSYPMYEMTCDGFTILAMGFTGISVKI